MPLKSAVTIRREMLRVHDQLRRTDLSATERAEQYGAQQALSWTLGNDAAPPTSLTHKPKASR